LFQPTKKQYNSTLDNQRRFDQPKININSTFRL